MKTLKQSWALLLAGWLLTALALNGLLVGCGGKEDKAQDLYLVEEGHAGSDNEHYLLESMMFMQRYLEKLYWAGKAGNAPLAAYYFHELEERVEGLAEAKVKYDGIDISELVKIMLIPTLEAEEETLNAAKPETFVASYQKVMGSCNNCHTTSKKPFIQLQLPESNPWTGQVFRP
jgi:hypothetical protein